MCYTLPKIWVGRIQKYWDKVIPMNYPVTNSVFALTFSNEEDKEAVMELESKINTEESPIAALIPEGSFINEYIGTYDVTYDGEVGEEGVYTLLSPEKINTKAEITALHFENGEWVKIEDATVENGYVYGTLHSFSPVAIIATKKDIHFETSVAGIKNITSFVVCEGNSVKVEVDEEGKTVVVNEGTGKKIELTTKSYIIGGSIDGTKIDSTSVVVKGIRTNALVNKIIGGSCNIEDGSVEVGTVNVTVIDCPAGPSITGSFGACRTQVANMTIKNSRINWAGAGESYAKVNVPPTSLASRAWLKKANWVVENSIISLFYLSQNNEYYYTEANEAKIVGGTYDYLISGGSNHATGSSVADVRDAKIGIYQSTNRGVVDSAVVKFTNCEVDNLFIGGDATDSTVTGTTNHIKIDIASGGKYNIVAGVEDGHLITAEDVERIVDSVKVTRAAEVTISDELKALLGNKYIIK